MKKVWNILVILLVVVMMCGCSDREVEEVVETEENSTRETYDSKRENVLTEGDVEYINGKLDGKQVTMNLWRANDTYPNDIVVTYPIVGNVDYFKEITADSVYVEGITTDWKYCFISGNFILYSVDSSEGCIYYGSTENSKVTELRLVFIPKVEGEEADLKGIKILDETEDFYVGLNNYKNESIELLDQEGSVLKTFGDKVDLKDSVYYQDLVCDWINTRYGLSCKNAELFTAIDDLHIVFSGLDENQLNVRIAFDWLKKEDVTVDGLTSVKNGEFAYYTNVNDGIIHIFKGNEYLASIWVEYQYDGSINSIGDLGWVFSIQKGVVDLSKAEK